MKEIARREQYFNWKRMRVANFTKVLNERDCEYYIDFKRRKMRVANTKNANMKLYIQDCTSF